MWFELGPGALTPVAGRGGHTHRRVGSAGDRMARRRAAMGEPTARDLHDERLSRLLSADAAGNMSRRECNMPSFSEDRSHDQRRTTRSWPSLSRGVEEAERP